MLNITCNGENKTLTTPCSLEQALQQLGYTEHDFAVAVNMQVIPRSLYTSTVLNNGDQIEIVCAAVGG